MDGNVAHGPRKKPIDRITSYVVVRYGGGRTRQWACRLESSALADVCALLSAM